MRAGDTARKRQRDARLCAGEAIGCLDGDAVVRDFAAGSTIATSTRAWATRSEKGNDDRGSGTATTSKGVMPEGRLMRIGGDNDVPRPEATPRASLSARDSASRSSINAETSWRLPSGS
jgi:hypothetical protein